MARILIIDDDDQVRKMLRQTFERNGYEVMEATDGGKAIELHSRAPAEIVITDLIMPGKEGIETIRDFLKKFPDVKLIAMSGGGRVGPEAYLKVAKSFGVSYTFTKPIDRKELLKAVANLLE